MRAQNRTRRTRRQTVRVWIFLVLFFAIAGTAYIVPSATAAICPACYGFEQIQSGVYAQKAASTKERFAIVSAIAEAREQLADFWGPLQAKPTILVCSDDDCFLRLNGGRRRGMSLFDRVAVLSPRGIDPVIAAHELSMNELNHRIGFSAFINEQVPIWFNEGVAIYASDDLRYLAVTDENDRCLVPAPDHLPSGIFAWNRQAATDPHLYAKAACRTSMWMAAHGGPLAAVGLIDRIAAGQSFDEAAR